MKEVQVNLSDYIYNEEKSVYCNLYYIHKETNEEIFIQCSDYNDEVNVHKVVNEKKIEWFGSYFDGAHDDILFGEEGFMYY